MSNSRTLRMSAWAITVLTSLTLYGNTAGHAVRLTLDLDLGAETRPAIFHMYLAATDDPHTNAEFYNQHVVGHWQKTENVPDTELEFMTSPSLKFNHENLNYAAKCYNAEGKEVRRFDPENGRLVNFKIKFDPGTKKLACLVEQEQLTK